MKILRILPLLIFTLLSFSTFAHNIDYTSLALRKWELNNNHEQVYASFLMYKNGEVYLEKQDGATVHFPLAEMSAIDQGFVKEKYSRILHLNSEAVMRGKASTASYIVPDFTKLTIVAFALLMLSIAVYYFLPRYKFRYVGYFIAIGLLSTLYSFKMKALKQITSTSNPWWVDSAFTPFKPNVHTLWDNNYFYVESKGIPTTHKMMVGISSHGWQQQVPIPQCYLGTNAWSIPLNPVMASNPIPVDSIHFTRGAIALAVNGIPIFNVHTNTGVDSYIDGQLDNFGGHCGRADDYHYHIAPLHLYSYTSATRPIAFGLDGYAVYGALEPDGAPMMALDANHGHNGNDGVYHYHGTTAAPYMIANMAGQVTEDATHQLIPQAAAHPVRPSLTPLSGAVITNCVPNANNNGYTITYTLNGNTDSVVYSWNNSGVYSFSFYTTSGLTSNTYNGFTQCQLPTSITELMLDAKQLQLYPNPTKAEFTLLLDNNINRNDVKSIFVFSGNGQLVYSTNAYTEKVKTSDWAKGTYVVTVNTVSNTFSKQLIVE